ncbi:TetR/AcrR family transcriptional regulator [Saccharothrix violaceirubra]|uniref:AcrR family transcriptional regulator n=1 Tax=Saccharothrix violaceirubra TaxID=413306 RepID=A0A7W7WWL6_9PSEU|nr:TetR/AcrR family transcriptional regulator [Saccharothrix violaceirubra]MBB4966241.1 AcrR family transcriptional regulator [Saccharothrix violaceirubra]
MTAYLARRPKRADGRRNYDNILTAARTAFDAHGTDAALEDIARNAGVAIGTLYGHFPTRETLIEASVRDSLDALRDRAEELTAHAGDDPVAALTTWFHQSVAHCSTYRGLVGFLTASTYDEGTPLHQSCVDMHGAGGALLAMAQEAGRVRADLTPTDLFTAITSAAWARESSPPGEDHSVRLIGFLIDAFTR